MGRSAGRHPAKQRAKTEDMLAPLQETIVYAFINSVVVSEPGRHHERRLSVH